MVRFDKKNNTAIYYFQKINLGANDTENLKVKDRKRNFRLN